MNGKYLQTIVSRFLLVSLNIDAILGEVTIAQRRKKLEVMARGNGLSDAYTATLGRLRAQKGNKSVLGLKVLMWVVYAERPLLVDELSHALAVEIGSADLDPNNVPALRTLLSSCLGLVTVEASSSTVRLVHFTLQEHLLSDPTLFHIPHSTLAEVCLTYLNFGSVWDLSPTVYLAPSTLPLLGYASLHWGKHTKLGMTESVKILGLRLLDRFDEHISAQLLLLSNNKYNRSGPFFLSRTGPVGFTGLHGVSFLGITGLVASVLGMKEWDVNTTDCTGSTALTWAATRGHEEVVKALFELEDINPDKTDTVYGRTPLSRAAENGHERVVKMLLERDGVNPDRADTKYGRTPLLRAAGNGHELVVKMLLERDGVNLDRADTKYGQTPLSWASKNGHEGVVKLLLQREDINPDHADTFFGQTPLAWAAEGGHREVVGLLLEREGVDPNKVDTRTGRTPLSWAASCGRVGVVKILLARKDIHTATPDNGNQTPLLLALSGGHDEVVRILQHKPNSQTAGPGS